MSAHEKATPRPWRVTKCNPTIISNDGGDKWLARALIGPTKSPRFLHDSEQAEANAVLIVEAVNSYDELIGMVGTHRDEVALLVEEIEALKAGDWQPMETAPKTGAQFLATHETSGVVRITWFGKTSHVPLYGWCEGEDAEGIDLWQPTHWLPLPKPPVTP